MPELKALYNIRKLATVGEVFDCDDQATADELIANGAAELCSSSESEPESVDNESRIASIGAVIQSMMAEDPDKANELFWKNDGAPRIAAVRKQLDFEATGDEVDEVYKALQVADPANQDGPGE